VFVAEEGHQYDLFLFSFRREKPSWKEIARNKSRLVTQLLKSYDKRIRPYTGGRKQNLSNMIHCIFDGGGYPVSQRDKSLILKQSGNTVFFCKKAKLPK